MRIPSKRELIIIPKKDISPTNQHKKFDFVTQCILTEEENETAASQLRKRQSAKILKFSFESFPIFSKTGPRNEGDKHRSINMIPSEKSFELISRTGSNFNLKFGISDKKSLFGLKTKNMTPSIEDFNFLIEKAPNINSPKKLEPKTPNAKLSEEKSMSEHIESGNYHELIGELEFDKMKIYKFYFIHNNIDQIIAKANAFLQKRRVFNPRKNRKILIKKSCQRKIYPGKSES